MGLLIGGHRVLGTRGLAGTLSLLVLGSQGHLGKSQEQKEGGTGRRAAPSHSDAWRHREAGIRSVAVCLGGGRKSHLSD